MKSWKGLKFSWQLMNEHPFFERMWRSIKIWLGGKVFYHPNKTRAARVEAALSAWKNEALQSRASMELMMRGLDERDELKRQVAQAKIKAEADSLLLDAAKDAVARYCEIKRQIREGELVNSTLVFDWLIENEADYGKNFRFYQDVKTYAAVRQKEAVPLTGNPMRRMDDLDPDESMTPEAREALTEAARQKEGVTE